jgi:hypothetical protein
MNAARSKIEAKTRSTIQSFESGFFFLRRNAIAARAAHSNRFAMVVDFMAA